MSPRSLFDHLNAVYTNQSLEYFDTLDEADKKTYSAYMINRFISMNPTYLPLVNEVQKLLGVLRPREHYLIYSQALPKGRQHNAYIKGKKEEKYPEWMVDATVKYFEVNLHDAIDYIDMMYMTEGGRQNLRLICEYFGTDPKLLKKASL